MHDSLKPEYFFLLSSFEHAELFQDCSHVWVALKKLPRYLAGAVLGNIEVEIPEGVHLEKPELISIGRGTKIEPGAFIRGPCIIGKNCTVRHGAYIRGELVTGDHCVIGHATEVKSAIFLNEAHAAHFAYVGDSILGNRVNLGAGTKCANLKLDNSTVAINYEGERISTGLRKFGAVIGDDSQLGCNSVTNPGTLVGQKVFCYPCLNIGGFVPSCRMIKSNAKNSVAPLSKSLSPK